MKELKLTWKCVDDFKKEVSSYKGAVDCVVGILNGGGIFAIVAAKVLDVPLYFIESKRYSDRISNKSVLVTRRDAKEENIRCKTVLLVDDLIDDGATMTAVTNELHQLSPQEVIPLVYITKDKHYCILARVDYLKYVKKGTWVIFPWETK